MSRELKLALILGFSFVLAVTVLVSDHWRTGRGSDLASLPGDDPNRMTTVGKLDGKKDVLTPVQPLPEPEPRPVVTQKPEVGPSPKVDPQGENGLKTSPLPSGPAPTTTPDRDYTIAEGDTLYKIAKQTYSDAALHKALAEYNKLGDGRGLKVGAKIRLPDRAVLTGDALPFSGPVKTSGNAPKPEISDIRKAMETTVTYRVQAGDTLSAIARKVGCSVSKLLELNKSLRGREDSLTVGAELNVPKKGQ